MSHFVLCGPLLFHSGIGGRSLTFIYLLSRRNDATNKGIQSVAVDPVGSVITDDGIFSDAESEANNNSTVS